MVFFWLAAVFLTVFIAKLWLSNLYGSALPWWEQWETEAWGLYIPFFEKSLSLKDLFAAHEGRSIFFNRALSLGLLVLNGQWDASVQMVLNALLAAGSGVLLSFFAWELLGKKHLAVICLFNSLIFSLPFCWQCVRPAFATDYFLVFLALPAVWLLLENRFFSGKWFFGLFCALLGLAAMEPGLYAPAAVLTIFILRLIQRPGRPAEGLMAVIVMLAVVAAGIWLMLKIQGHLPFKPDDMRAQTAEFFNNLAWPNTDQPWKTILVWLPSLLLFGLYISGRIEERRSAEFIICFGLWVVFQDADRAFLARGTLAAYPAVFSCLSLPVNFLALLLLARRRSWMPFLSRCLAVIFLVWLGNAACGLWKIPYRHHFAEAAKFKNHLFRSEKNVGAFLRSNNIADLENKPFCDIPYHDPQALAVVLRNPHIRAILPSCVAKNNKPGPLSVFAAELLPQGRRLLLAALALLAVLAGIRFYQSLGALEKRVLSLRWKDFRLFLIQTGVVLAAAALAFAAGQLYIFQSPYGLTVTYFRGINFEEKIISRTEQAVCRDYGTKPPDLRVPSENFSAIWEGILRVPETGEYFFFSQSDDGLRLIIDGRKIIDNWRDQSWGASGAGAKTHLSAGDHRIAVEHYNRDDEAALRVKWCGGPVPPNTVLSAPYLRKRE